MNTFDDTKKCNAMYYLDDSGKEINRKEFIESLFLNKGFNEFGYMLYVGGGYTPLRIAIISWNESDAISTFEEWARNSGKADEIGEDEEWEKACKHAEIDGKDYPETEYEIFTQKIPFPIVIMSDCIDDYGHFEDVKD